MQANDAGKRAMKEADANGANMSDTHTIDDAKGPDTETDLDAPSVVAWLQRRGALRDVIEWADAHGGSWEAFWNDCPRGDWLLGVAARAGVPTDRVLRAALACVPVLEPYLPEREPAVPRALAWVQRVASGEAIDVAVAAQVMQDIEAVLARCHDASANSAVMAIAALLHATDDIANAASVVVATLQAAVMDAGDCGMMQAARFTEHECAERVRTVIDAAAIEHALRG